MTGFEGGELSQISGLDWKDLWSDLDNGMRRDGDYVRLFC